jgi:hypothetical protein
MSMESSLNFERNYILYTHFYLYIVAQVKTIQYFHFMI